MTIRNQELFKKADGWIVWNAKTDHHFNRLKQAIIVNADAVTDVLGMELHWRDKIYRCSRDKIQSYKAQPLINSPERFKNMRYHYVPLQEWEIQCQ